MPGEVPNDEQCPTKGDGERAAVNDVRHEFSSLCGMMWNDFKFLFLAGISTIPLGLWAVF